MAFRALRPAVSASRGFAVARGFHSTRPAFVKVGSEIPNLAALRENSPANKVNLAEEFKKTDGLIIGVPGAFSPGCSATHIPSYIMHPNIKDVGQVFVVAVNDPFVMKAWGESLDPVNQAGFRYLADPSGEFTKALELDFDATGIFGGARSKRYALIVQNGVVKSAHVEPDSTGTNESMANVVLGGPARIDWNA